MSSNDISLASLPGFETVSGIIGDLPMYFFNRVVSLHYDEKNDLLGGRWHDVELIMSDGENATNAIGFLFHRVADIRCSNLVQIMGLYFENIQDRGWEELNCEIGDYEDNNIHFYCQKITLFRPPMQKT